MFVLNSFRISSEPSYFKGPFTLSEIERVNDILSLSPHNVNMK